MQQKSNYFFGHGLLQSESWSGPVLSWQGGQAPPPACNTKLWFCVGDRGGQAPPCPGQKFTPWLIQNLHYGKTEFSVAGQGGHAPLQPGHKTTVLCRKHGNGRISTPMARQKLSFWGIKDLDEIYHFLMVPNPKTVVSDPKK